MKTKAIILITISLLMCLSNAHAQKKVMFDLSHGQCQGSAYTADILPDYQKMAQDRGADFVLNRDNPLTSPTLEDVDVLILMSCLHHEFQKNITSEEAAALVDFVNGGGALLVFVDEESHRVNLKDFNINSVLEPFGMQFGDDLYLPGNCGAASFPGEIFKGRYEVPYSGSRTIKGGIPASACMEEGHLHSAYVKLPGGGKLYACAEIMVSLLMGGEEGRERKGPITFNQTGWFGKDSRKFIGDLLDWALESSDEDEAAVREIVHKYTESINTCDPALVDSIWSDADYVSFIGPAGRYEGRDDIRDKFVIGIFGNGFSKRNLIGEDLKVTVNGNSAWCEFTWRFEATRKDGKSHTGRGRETQILEKTPSGWKLVHVHYSGLR